MRFLSGALGFAFVLAACAPQGSNSGENQGTAEPFEFGESDAITACTQAVRSASGREWIGPPQQLDRRATAVRQADGSFVVTVRRALGEDGTCYREGSAECRAKPGLARVLKPLWHDLDTDDPCQGDARRAELDGTPDPGLPVSGRTGPVSGPVIFRTEPEHGFVLAELAVRPDGSVAPNAEFLGNRSEFSVGIALRISCSRDTSLSILVHQVGDGNLLPIRLLTAPGGRSVTMKQGDLDRRALTGTLSRWDRFNAAPDTDAFVAGLAFIDAVDRLGALQVGELPRFEIADPEGLLAKTFADCAPPHRNRRVAEGEG